MKPRLSRLVLAAWLVLLAPALSRAEPPGPGPRERAEAAVARGDWSAAVAELTAALDRHPTAPEHALRARALAERAGAWGRTADADRALADATRAIELDPRNADAHACLGFARSLRCEHQAASAACDRALALAPTSALAYRYRGRVRWRNDDWAGALADYSEALKHDPRDFNAHIDRAEVYRSRGERAKALADAEKAVKLAPNAAFAYAARSAAHLAHRSFDLARADAETAARLAPAHPVGLVARADVYTARFQPAEALKAINEALERAPGSVAYARRASINIDRGQPDLALADCRRALRFDPFDGYAYTRAVSALRIKLEIGRARAAADEALKLYPRSPELLALRGECRNDLRDTVGGAADLRAALQLDPRHTGAMMARAGDLILAGNHTEAVAELDRVLGIDPEHGTALAYRSGCLERLGRADEAEKSFAAAKRLDLATAYAERGWVRLNSGEALDGFADLDRGLAERPEAPNALLCRAWYRLTVTQEFALARADADRACRLAPESSDAVFVRAQVRDAAGDTDGALADLARAIELDPAFVGARALRAQILLTKQKYLEALDDADDALSFDPDEPGALAARATAFAMLAGGKGHKFGAPVGAGEVTGGPRPGVFAPRAVLTPGGVRVRFAEPAWLGGTGDTKLKPGEAHVPMQTTSPDGRSVAAKVDPEFGIVVLDTRTSAVRFRVPRELSEGLNLFWFSPDGTTLVTRTSGRRLHLWNVETGRELADTSALVKVASAAVWAADAWLTGARHRKLAQNWPGVVAIHRDVVVADGRRVVAVQSGTVQQYRVPLTYERAVADVSRAVRLEPTWEEPLIARGLCHLAAERYGHAKEDFSRAIEINAKHPEPYFYRAVIHQQAGETERAIEDFSAAIGLDNEDALAHLERGLLYLAKGEYKLAKADLDRAVALDPKLKSRLPSDR